MSKTGRFMCIFTTALYYRFIPAVQALFESWLEISILICAIWMWNLNKRGQQLAGRAVITRVRSGYYCLSVGSVWKSACTYCLTVLQMHRLEECVPSRCSDCIHLLGLLDSAQSLHFLLLPLQSPVVLRHRQNSFCKSDRRKFYSSLSLTLSSCFILQSFPEAAALSSCFSSSGIFSDAPRNA